MTSTTFSDKKKNTLTQSRSMLLWAIKRNRAPMVVLSVLLFALLPCAILFLRSMFYSYFLGSEELVYGGENFVWSLSSEGYYLNKIIPTFYAYPVTIMVMVFSLIFGMGAFKYLQNKRTVDMFGALPVNRRGMFFSQLTGALLCTLIPLTLVTGIAMLCVIPCGEVALALLIMYMYLALAVIANIAFIGLISVCCGTAKDVITSYVVISIVYPLAVAISATLPAELIPGIVDSNINALLATALCTFVSPFAAFESFSLQPFVYSAADLISSSSVLSSFYVPGGFVLNNAFDFAHIIYWIIFSAVCVALSYFLIKRRKAESAQAGFAFSLPEIIIRIFADFIGGAVVGISLGSVCGNIAPESAAVQYIWFFAGMICGSFIVHLLLQVIYRKGFKGFAKSLIYYGGTVAVTSALFIVLVTGGFGADVFVPNADEVQAVCFDLEDDSTSGGYTESNGVDYYIENGYSENDDYIKMVTDLHKSVTETLRAGSNYPYKFEYTGFENGDMYSYVDTVQYLTVKYKLKNGKTVERRYESYNGKFTSIEKYSTQIEDIYNTAAYQRSKSGIDLVDDESQLSGLTIYFDMDWDSYYFTPDNLPEGAIDEVFKALCDDMPKNTNPLKGEMTRYTLNFDSENQDGYCCTNAIAVRDTYTKTLEVLEKYGLTNKEVCENYYASNSGTASAVESAHKDYVYIEAPESFDKNGGLYLRAYYDESEEGLTGFLSDKEKCEYVGDGLYRLEISDRANVYGATVSLSKIQTYTFDKENIGESYKSSNKVSCLKTGKTYTLSVEQDGSYKLSEKTQ